MLKIYKILSIFIIFNLFCAESTKEIIIRYHLPKEVLANIAEFMPANSKFVNYIARISKLSSQKYYDIAKDLICRKNIDIINLNKRYQNIKISYDYDDIDNLIQKYFNTTPKTYSNVDNNFLQEKMREAFISILKNYPEIAFIANLYKLDIQKINMVIERELTSILLIRKSLEINNILDFSSKSDEEIKLMHSNLTKEYIFLLICSNALTDIISSKKANIKIILYAIYIRGILFVLLPYPILIAIPLILSIFTLPIFFIHLMLVLTWIFFDLTNSNVLKKTINPENINLLFYNLLNNFEDDQTRFYQLYRQRIPISDSEIIETARLCIKNPAKSEEYKNHLTIGLAEDKKQEVLQNLNLEIDLLRYN